VSRVAHGVWAGLVRLWAKARRGMRPKTFKRIQVYMHFIYFYLFILMGVWAMFVVSLVGKVLKGAQRSWAKVGGTGSLGAVLAFMLLWPGLVVLFGALYFLLVLLGLYLGTLLSKGLYV
jgi:hypothetical protein